MPSDETTKEINDFIKWLKEQEEIAGKASRSDEKEALKGVRTSIENFKNSPAEGQSSRWSARNDPEGPLLETMRSFKKMHETTTKLRAACEKTDPMTDIDKVTELASQSQAAADETEKSASKMEDGSVRAAVAAATAGGIGGAIACSLKYAHQFGTEWAEKFGGSTIPGVVAAIIGIAVGLIGGAIYGASTYGKKGWEAGKNWEADRNSEEKSTRAAFEKASDTYTAARSEAQKSHAPLEPLPDTQNSEQQEDKPEDDEELAPAIRT